MAEILMLFAAFFVGLLTDWVWTKCIKCVQDHQAIWAANWSAGIYLCGVFSTLIIIEKNPWMILAYIIGGYIGTYVGVKHHNKLV